MKRSKRYISLILAAAVFFTAAASCGSDKSAASETTSAVTENIRVAASDESEAKEYMLMLRTKFKEYTELSKTLEEAQENKDADKADETVKAIKRVFDDIRKAVPPNEYTDDHTKICDALKTEERFVDNWARLIGFYIKGAENLTESEASEARQITENMDTSDMSFGNAVLETVKKIKANEE